jgi:hypothetical protein
MQADELLAKLLFEMGQRLVEQVFPITGARGDVLQVSLEVNDPGHRNQQQTTAFVAGEVAAHRAAGCSEQVTRRQRHGSGRTFCKAASKRCARTGFNR